MFAVDFKYKENFPTLQLSELERALSTVQVIFSGVFSLWGHASRFKPRWLAEKKRDEVWNLLMAWQLMQWHPEAAVGVASNGAMPLKSKAIENIKLTFLTVSKQENSLELLSTNPFGVEALFMLQYAPEMFLFIT